MTQEELEELDKELAMKIAIRGSLFLGFVIGLLVGVHL